ncbi:hypothetical protein DdX_13594 [Ditylenchus destructor]|uniref:N-acetyltransferase domain-containing protein n=1 Tax=Ditylenchus destructor TaxID=166010 RepID=A0AAD4MTA7_9BILA|nr:hypothetical protein DdX_13594 [Ditylenchus destructor]
MDILAYPMRNRKTTDDKKQKPKPNPPYDRPREDKRGCHRKNCSKPPDSVRCGKKRCTNDNQCFKWTNNVCKYCVSQRCVSKKPKQSEKQERSPDPSEERSNENRKLRRFTRVSRAYLWKRGRPTQTRPPQLVQCILTKCRNDKQCKKTRQKHRRRVKRVTMKCNKCDKLLGQCNHYARKADRWKDEIKEKSFGNSNDRGIVYVPGPGSDLGTLGFEKAKDDNGDDYVKLQGFSTVPYAINNGIGTALMEYAIEEIVMKRWPHIRHVTCDVLDGRDNERGAIQVYEGVGFQWDDPDDDHMTLNINEYRRRTLLFL